jgi:hypothetical protein
MGVRRKVNQFILTCFTGGLLGAAFCGVGILFSLHSHSEQRRLWTSSKFVISSDSFEKNSKYVNFSFTPTEKKRYFMNLCISPVGYEQYEKIRNSSEPLVDWQVLNGGQPIQVEVDSEKSWSLHNPDGACISLGSFRGMNGQEHQIKFRVNHLELPPPGSQLLLAVVLDRRAAKEMLINYQVASLFFPIIGVATFVVSIFKGLFDFFKNSNMKKGKV